MLIINAKIFTMAGEIIENGYINVVGRKICKVGGMDDLDFSDNEVFDAVGMEVYPGFIDAHTHLGMFEDGLSFEGDDGNEYSEPVTPQLRAIDAVNPLDRCFEEALMAGVTTVVTGPGSANPIAGQIAAIKTSGKRIDDMIVKQPVAMKFALGENPKNVYHERNQSPITRMATTSLIREQLHKAKRYYEEKLEAEKEDSDYDLPDYDAKCEALVPLLSKQIHAHFHAHRADDIFTAIRIAKEFDIDYVIVHGTEGHMIANELKEEGTRVLSGPFLSDRSKPELSNLTPRTPGVLSNAGVETAIVTDHPVIPLQYLPICAGLAVKEGMSREDALRAITIAPAKICGIEDAVGSIEVGKDADLVMFDSDPLSVMAEPKVVVCNGNFVKKYI